MRRSLAIVGVAVVGLILCIAAPIIWVERSCFLPAQAQSISALKIDSPGYHRAEGDSFLSFPEWYIVYAYSDLAGVTRNSSESNFNYFKSIEGFWSSLCQSSKVASSIGSVTADQKTTNYVIGVSFTAEMGLQGLYERSVGALTQMTSSAKTPEDRFNLELLDDYTAFLYQTPWYQYPFGQKLVQLWTDVPFTFSLRSIERRFALSLQYGVKSLYAALIRYAAGYAPADLVIQSVVTSPTDIARADSRVRVLGPVKMPTGEGALIEAPRYQAFTDIVRKLGSDPFVEIAGNRRILTTLIAPLGFDPHLNDTKQVFSIPIQSQHGKVRIGFDTPVSRLVQQIANVEQHGARFEHIYDY